MWRYLDEIERPMVDVPEGKHIVQYQGEIDVDLMRDALLILSKRYPILRGHIRCRNGRPAFDVRHSLPDFKVVYGELDKILPNDHGIPYLDRTNKGFLRRLANLTICLGKSSSYLNLNIHHVATSGGLGPALLSELCDVYTTLIRGNDIVARVGYLPKSPSEILHERWILQPKASYADLERMSSTVEPALTKRLKYDVEFTQQIITHAKESNRSVNLMLLSEVLEAVRHHFENKTDVISVATKIDLKRRVDPPVETTGTTLLTGECIARIPITTKKHEISDEYQRQLDLAIDKKNIMIRGFNVNNRAPSLGSQADISWNAIGVLPALNMPSNVQIQDYMEGHYKYGEIHFKRTPLKPLVNCFSYTFHGQLSLWIHATSSRSPLVDEIEERILGLVPRVK